MTFLAGHLFVRWFAWT